MKKSLVLTLAVLMVLACAACSMAAIYTDDFEYDTDTWYGIGEVYKYAEVNGLFIDGFDDFLLKGKFYVNEQTFAEINYLDAGSDDGFGIAGSYLFENNFFLGLSTGDIVNFPAAPVFSIRFPLAIDGTVISAGYRFNFGEKNFVAMSLDYCKPDYVGARDDFFLDVYGKWFFDNARVIAHLNLPKDSDIDPYFLLKGNLKVQENFVVGAAIENVLSETNISAGLTWKPEPFVIDGTVGVDFYDDFYFGLSGMYCFDENMLFGAEVSKSEDADAMFSAKFKYINDAGSFKLAYAFETDTNPKMLTLDYTWFFE